MKNLMKLDYGKALKFNFTARYIDDLLSLNNTLFMNEIPNIHPQELVLNRTSESDVHVSYLDSNISIKHNFIKLMCMIKAIILIAEHISARLIIRGLFS